MTQIHDEELTQFLMDDLPLLRRTEIHNLAESDTELAARIEVTQFLIEAIAGLKCVSRASSAAPQDGRLRRLLARHRVVISMTALILVLTATGASAWMVISAPLMRDDLSSGWFDSTKWLRPPEEVSAGGVIAEKGHIRLVNRGYLRTRREFSEPIDIRFEWKWHQLSLNPLYADHLGVAIRSNAKPNIASAAEAADGVIIKFNAWNGSVYIHDQENVCLAQTTEGAFPLPADEWHHIRITDDGETIAVYISGPLITPEHAAKPALTLRNSKGGGRRIAIYNRELVQFPHESCIRHFAVHRLVEK